MTTDSQPQSNVKTQTKLSAAQVKMLKNLASSAPTTYNQNTAKSLEKRGLVLITRQGFSGRSYALTLDGQETVRALTGTQPALAPATPVIAQSAPVETPVIAETPAATEYKAGDTIRYHHMVAPQYKHWIFTGEILQVSKATFLGSKMYYVRPEADDRIADLSPKWIMPHEIEGQEIETVDELESVRRVNDAYAKWEEAHLAGRIADAARLDIIHRQLEDEHNERMFPRKRPQTGKEGVSSPSTASQVTSIEMDAQPAEIAFTRDCERNRQKERRWASDAAQQFGIDQSSAPRPPVVITMKPTRAMNAAEQASHDALQAMIRAAGGAS